METTSSRLKYRSGSKSGEHRGYFSEVIPRFLLIKKTRINNITSFKLYGILSKPGLEDRDATSGAL